MTNQNWSRALVGSFSSSIGIMLVGLLTGIIIARTLGPEGRGVLATVVTVATMIACFAQFPISEAMVVGSTRFDESRLFGAAIRTSLAITLMMIGPALLIQYAWFRGVPDLPVVGSLVYATVFLASQMFTHIYRGILQVRREFRAVQLYAVTQPVLYLAFLVPLWFGLAPPNVSVVLAALTTSMIVNTAIAFRRLLRNGAPLLGQTDFYVIRSVAKTAAPLQLSSILGTLGGQGDRLLVVTLVDLKLVGIYVVAATFASVIPGVFSTAIKLLALPALVSVDVSLRSAQATRLISLSWLAGLFGLMATAILAPFVVPFLFGAEFAAASNISILIAATLALRNVRESHLDAIKSYRVSLALSYSPALLFGSLAIGSFVLFPLFGIYGIIAARGLAEVLTLALLSRQLRVLAPEIKVRDWIVPRPSDINYAAAALRNTLFRRGGTS